MPFSYFHVHTARALFPFAFLWAFLSESEASERAAAENPGNYSPNELAR